MSSNQSFGECSTGAGPDPRDWAVLTRQIAAGDSDSFACYYECFFDLMYRQAQHLTGMDESTCLDIVHTAMLRVIRGMKPMQDEARLVAWTRVVVRNAAIDFLRKTARRMERELTHDASNKTENTDLLDVHARIVWVEQQLRKMNPELRRMVLLRYRLGWTLEEVAAKFGLKTGAVDGRIRRAEEKLRQQAEWEFTE